jgi:hypothetical protein
VTAAVGARGTGSRRGVVVGVGLLLVIVVIALLATGGDKRRSGPSLSPSSDTEDGTSAFVALLGKLGASATVVTSTPTSTDQTALLLRDTLSAGRHRELEAWVRAGGHLVVADPTSELAAPVKGVRAGDHITRGECDVDGIDLVESIRTANGMSGLDLPSPVSYRPSESARSCFGGYVVQQDDGDGVITSIGGAEPFVNALLATEDGSTLGVDLLAPTDSERVAIIDVVPAPGQGSETLTDLIAPRVAQAFGLAVAAFVLYAISKGRRLGRPVREEQRVVIPGSGLVAAVGHLQQRTGNPDRAATAVRSDVRRAIVRQLGLSGDASDATIAEAVAARTGLDAARVHATLADGHVPDERALVALTHELDTIRQEVLHARR